jgi:hypothetical protein
MPNSGGRLAALLKIMEGTLGTPQGRKLPQQEFLQATPPYAVRVWWRTLEPFTATLLILAFRK